MNNIGQQIKYLRKLNNLSQPELATLIGVAKSVISNWELNKNIPRADYLNKLADIFHVTTDYILRREEEDGRIIIQEPELPSDEKKLLEEYRALSPELKALSRDYFNSLNALNKNNNHNRNNDN